MYVLNYDLHNLLEPIYDLVIRIWLHIESSFYQHVMFELIVLIILLILNYISYNNSLFLTFTVIFANLGVADY